MKVLAYAYKDVSADSYHQMTQEFDIESKEFRSELEQDLIYIGTFGLEDPLRDNVEDTINQIRYGTRVTNIEDAGGV